MRYTMKKIGELAGVSQSTVSRVLSGDKRISEATRQKILAIVEGVGFHPDSNARNLVMGTTNTIGVILSVKDEKDFFNDFFQRSLFAIEKIARNYDYNVLLLNYEDKLMSDAFEKILFERKIDGLILPSVLVHEQLIEVLKKSGIRFVIIGEPPAEFADLDWIDIDNKKGSIMAVEYFNTIKKLDRKYLLVRDNETLFNKKRISGFRASTANKSDILILNKCEDWLEKMVEKVSHEKVGVIAGDNEIAWVLHDRLQKYGKWAGKDYFLITFDKMPLVELMDFEIVVIDINTEQLGIQVAELLFSKMKGEQISIERYIPTKLIEHKKA